MDIIIIPVVLSGAYFDLKFGKIFNRLTYPAICAALILNAFDSGFNGLLNSISGAVLGISLFIIPYTIGASGAGDAKLMGAVGAALGPKAAFTAAIFTFLLGGLYALGLLLYRERAYGWALLSRWKSTSLALVRTGQWIPAPAATEKGTAPPRLRYGVVIALGTFLYMALNYAGYDLF
ncbi:MAG: A24 family peptidase [Syntrophales bacterium]|nr:A24 family peptidase [Syntrophales bacterium]MDY0043617.1 A24 family peptidase [Syntrophales bacterium]